MPGSSICLLEAQCPFIMMLLTPRHFPITPSPDVADCLEDPALISVIDGYLMRSEGQQLYSYAGADVASAMAECRVGADFVPVPVLSTF